MKRVILALLAVAIVACSPEKKNVAPTRKHAATTPAIEELPSPAGAGSAEPFLFAARDGVLLSWLEPVPNSDRTALRFARYGDGKWSAPRTIVERNDLFVNWADFPSIVEDAKGDVVRALVAEERPQHLRVRRGHGLIDR